MANEQWLHHLLTETLPIELHALLPCSSGVARMAELPQYSMNTEFTEAFEPLRLLLGPFL